MLRLLLSVSLFTITASYSFDLQQLNRIDSTIAHAIAAKQIPGAVVHIASHGAVAFHKAYGNRALYPTVEPMTTDTLFDLASITKPLATATTIMKLYERGVLALNDSLATHLPIFKGTDKAAITIDQLLCHYSGLPAEVLTEACEHGIDNALDAIKNLPLNNTPGTTFEYSCIGYIVLGEIIEAITGKSIAQNAKELIFDPLRMHNTLFNPPVTIHGRIAPTESRKGILMRGQVHDPRAYALGGARGNAGLFSTAADVARFAQMILNNGQLDDLQFLKPETVALMRSPSNCCTPDFLFGLGFNINTKPPSEIHTLFAPGSFGHTGWVGTFLWIDPTSQTTIVVLTNQVHSYGKQNIVPLYQEISAIVAQALVN